MDIPFYMDIPYIFGFAMMLTVILTVKHYLNIKVVEMNMHN